MLSKKKILLVSLVAVAVAAAVFLFSTSETYRRYDLDGERYLLWLDRRGSFNRELERARQNNEPWATDPRQIALHLAGYPNPDGENPDKVDVVQTDAKTMTVIVFQDNLKDDAYSAEETKVVLVEKGGRWEIEWAGGRWKCHRDSYTGWTTSGCS